MDILGRSRDLGEEAVEDGPEESMPADVNGEGSRLSTEGSFVVFALLLLLFALLMTLDARYS